MKITFLTNMDLRKSIFYQLHFNKLQMKVLTESKDPKYYRKTVGRGQATKIIFMLSSEETDFQKFK